MAHHMALRPIVASRYCTTICAVGCLAVLGGSALAQDARPHLALIGIPAATVAPHGAGFAAVSFSNKRAPGDNSNDGSAVVGVGFGDATRNVGLQFAAHITSLEDDFGDSGYLSVRVARRLAPGPNPVYGSLIFGQLANWGDADGQDETVDVVLTRFSQLTFGSSQRSYPVMMTLGAGTHLRNDDTDPGIFAGVGIGLSQTMAASLAWTGESVTIGAGFKFKGTDNIRVNLSVDDAFNDIDNRRIIVSVGYRFNKLFGG